MINYKVTRTPWAKPTLRLIGPMEYKHLFRRFERRPETVAENLPRPYVGPSLWDADL